MSQVRHRAGAFVEQRVPVELAHTRDRGVRRGHSRDALARSLGRGKHFTHAGSWTSARQGRCAAPSSARWSCSTTSAMAAGTASLPARSGDRAAGGRRARPEVRAVRRPAPRRSRIRVRQGPVPTGSIQFGELDVLRGCVAARLHGAESAGGLGGTGAFVLLRRAAGVRIAPGSGRPHSEHGADVEVLRCRRGRVRRRGDRLVPGVGTRSHHEGLLPPRRDDVSYYGARSSRPGVELADPPPTSPPGHPRTRRCPGRARRPRRSGHDRHPAAPAAPCPGPAGPNAGALIQCLPPGYELLEEALTRIRALPRTP